MTDLARAAGGLVAAPLGALARWRHGKPMHPRGAVFEAELERHGAMPPTGVPWLDAVATDPEPVDLLLTTTGRGRLTRLVPLPRRDSGAVYSSIMAYRSDAGPVRIAALPERDGVPSDPRPLAEEVRRTGLAFTLAVARGAGEWRPFARLALLAPAEPLDPAVGFDAVVHPPPGLVADGPLARLRAPAYARARAAAQEAGGALTSPR